MSMNIKHIKIDTNDPEASSALFKMLDEGMDINITVTGDSMFPLWKHKRDSVVITRCEKTSLKKGDIPLYRRVTGQYIMHRIVKVNNDSYNLCGDAQTQVEYNIKAENIIGVVKAFTRKGKKYDCRNLLFRVYSVLWVAILPFRGIFLRVLSLLCP
jgi:hypothetical protein